MPVNDICQYKMFDCSFKVQMDFMFCLFNPLVTEVY